jgi:hypothetical protein
MSKLLTVACRLPHGLVIEVGKPGADNYRQLKLNGPFSKNTKGEGVLVVNGYAFTKVPEDFWNEFARAHKSAAYMVNRMVYAEDSDEKAHDTTKQGETAGKSGFEALDPEKPGKDLEPDQDHMRRVRSGTM